MKFFAMDAAPAAKQWHLFCLALFIVGYILAAIVPPFQAPDEFNHIQRTYMLGHGQFILHSLNGSPSGGYIDGGLMNYMDQFRPLAGHAERKISNDELASAATMQWSGTTKFENPVNVAYYFPALYAPQATGLVIGKMLGLSVSHSYRLARYLALVACTLILLLAFFIFPPPPLVLALLALPMNIFLYSSAVLDGMATATAVLALSTFMRVVNDRNATPTWILNTLIVSIALIASSRANTLPFLLLLFAAYWLIRSRHSLISAIVASTLSILWTIYTVKYTVYPSGPHNADHLARLLSYALHPLRFTNILIATFSDKGIMNYYATSFLGILGWLDTPLPTIFYYLLAAFLIATLVLSFSWYTFTEQTPARILIITCTLCAILMTFLALLVQWTDASSPVVQGVQGRYFAIPAIALAYALTANPRPRAGISRRLSMAMVAGLMCVSIYGTSTALISRYYVAPTQASARPPILRASSPLTDTNPISLHFSPAQIANPSRLNRLGLMFGTYMQSHPGKAALRLWTNNGETTTLVFELSPLVDNAYRIFPLDGKPYVGGEVVSQGGMGISLWESHIGDDNMLVSCTISQSSSGRVATTPGCPQQ